MLDSNSPGLNRFGFSTGALELGDFRAAIQWMINHSVSSVELSALRYDELGPLVNSLDELPLAHFNYISFHAPSSFPAERETRVIELLQVVSLRGWNIIVHPDVIYTPSRWKAFGNQLLIENMDRRKPIGRTANDLLSLFEDLPAAHLCLDVAHARQQDTTLNLLWEIVSELRSRIAEIHISELDSRCRHRPLSSGAVADYRRFAAWLGDSTPVIIESALDAGRSGLRMDELRLARAAMEPV